jgi:two-component sensor histidine kinase
MAEEFIQKLLEEKETLITEIHHRVKNNMNTIQSLLILQSGTLDDSSAVQALEEAAGRVGSMMVLYDKLYRSPDYEAISLRDYLPSLIDEILSNFPNKEKVNVQMEIGDIALSSKKLQSLGIIINELLTNIMKYAFKNKTNGTIKIILVNKDRKLRLEVLDNGIGMPINIDFNRSTGFGLMLIKNLTQQLNGNIDIERGNGTKVILEFEQ